MDYTGLKDLIEHYSGLDRDALHIHVALLIYILVAVLLRRSRHSLLPWLAVFGVLLANEVHDLWLDWSGGPAWATGESLKDLWNTMLWPTVLMLVGRHTSWTFWQTKPPRAGDMQARGSDAADADPAPVGARPEGQTGRPGLCVDSR